MLTPQQLEARKKGIGGSDAAKALGKSKWGTQYDLYNDKMGLSEPIETNTAMRVGSALEDMILDEYERHTGNKVTHFVDQPQPFKHINHPFMLANLDGFVEDKNIVVEAKTARDDSDWGLSGSNNIPADYLLQVMHYCAVMDADQADIIVFFKFSEKYGHYTYKRDRVAEEKLIDGEKRFWENYVLKQTPPPLASMEDVKKAFAPLEDKTQREELADNKLIELCDKILPLQERESILKKTIKELKDELAVLIGGDTILKEVDDRVVCTYKWGRRRSWNHDALMDKEPEIASQYSKIEDSRTLLIKKRKKS